MYIIATLTSKHSKMPSQSISSVFKNFPGGACPSFGKLCMLIVLCTATSYSQSKNLHFICVTMPDLVNHLDNCLWA